MNITDSERLALAAHLHVLFRRKLGRITDTEWMMSNDEYATEIIRLARQSGADDLIDAADKLSHALFDTPRQRPAKPLLTQIKEARENMSAKQENRYIGSLR